MQMSHVHIAQKHLHKCILWTDMFGRLRLDFETYLSDTYHVGEIAEKFYLPGGVSGQQ
jgi:hypothetical protein